LLVEDVAPYAKLQGMLAVKGNMRAVQVVGFDPKFEHKVSQIMQKVVAGNLDEIKENSFGVMLGQSLANSLDLKVGSNVLLILPQTSKTGALVPKLQTIQVRAVFATGLELDSQTVYLNISDAGKLQKLEPQSIGGLRLKLADFKTATFVSQNLALELGSKYVIRNWTDTRGSLFAAMQMEKTMISLLLSLIIAVAAFNIVSGLSMAVHQKSADIAILRTMGASSQHIMAIFMLQGLILGLAGIGLGLILGIWLTNNLQLIGGWLGSKLSFLGINPYFMEYLPTDLKFEDVIMICVLALVLSLLAAFYPAKQAAKLDPAGLLRSI